MKPPVDDPVEWQLRTRSLRLPRSDELPLVMGIVNTTPDSFSDGGLWAQTETAVAHGLSLIEAGADILDIGGGSGSYCIALAKMGYQVTLADISEELLKIPNFGQKSLARVEKKLAESNLSLSRKEKETQ